METGGPDENGNFVFGVDPSKTGPLFLINGTDNNTKIEVNTHRISNFSKDNIHFIYRIKFI